MDNNKLEVDQYTSLSKDIAFKVKERLSIEGFALINFKPFKDEKKLETDLLLTIFGIARDFSKDFSYYVLEGKGSPVRLAAHVEGIYVSNGITDGFALACIKPSESGGETRLFDSRQAAEIILKEYPEFAGTVIEYSSKSYPDQKAQYKLVENDVQFGNVLRYRSGEGCKIISSESDLSVEKLNMIVNEILEKTLIISHKWTRGQILFVNNRITLHDREPYEGERKMLRVRFGDYLNTALTY